MYVALGYVHRTYMETYRHACIHTNIHVQVVSELDMKTYRGIVCICIHTYIHTYTHQVVSELDMKTCRGIVCISIHTCTHTYKHTYTGGE